MPARFFPKLHTSRLLLSAFSEADAQDVFNYCRNPRVSRFTSWATHQSVQDSLGWIRTILQRESSEAGKTRHCWSICLQGEKAVIGAIEFTQTSSERGRVDYVLAEEHWNKGLVTEAAGEVIGWAFRSLPDLLMVESAGLTENIGSMRVMQKCGMTLQGRERMRFAKFNDEEREVSKYGIARSVWVQQTRH